VGGGSILVVVVVVVVVLLLLLLPTYLPTYLPTPTYTYLPLQLLLIYYYNMPLCSLYFLMIAAWMRLILRGAASRQQKAADQLAPIPSLYKDAYT